MANKKVTVDDSTNNDAAYELAEYSTTMFREMIHSKYNLSPDGYVYTDISLKRQKPGGIWAHVKKYKDLPEWDDIQNVYGGGTYKLWIQFKPSGSSWEERKLEIIDMVIDGPEKEIVYDAPAQHPAAQIDDQEEKFLRKLQLYKEVLGVGNNGNNNNNTNGDSGVMKAMVETQGKILEKLMDTNKPPERDPLVNKFMEAAITKGFEKSDTIESYVKIHGLISRLQGKEAAGDASLPEEIGKWLPVAEKALPMIQKILRPEGAPAGYNPALNNAGALPAPGGGVQQPPGDIIRLENAILKLAEKQDMTAGKIAAMEAKNGAQLPDDTNAAENDTEDDENESFTAAPEQITAEQEEENKRDAGMLKLLTPDLQAHQLKKYLGYYNIDQIYWFCMRYGVHESLEQFNNVMKIAGEPEYVPPVKVESSSAQNGKADKVMELTDVNKS